MKHADKRRNVIAGRGFLAAMAILCLVFCLLLVMKTLQIAQNQESILGLNNRYDDYVSASQLLRRGTDILSEQARLYVGSGKAAHLYAYFTEADSTRNKEAASVIIDAGDESFGVHDILEEAGALAAEMTAIECHAMKLAALAEGIPEEQIPYEAVREYPLTERETEMDSEEKRLCGQSLLYDETYEACREKMWALSESIAEKAIEGMRGTRLQLTEKQDNCLSLQRAYLVLFIISLCALAAFLFGSTGNELRRLKQLELALEHGSDLEKKLNAVETKANRDPLTGVKNITAYTDLVAHLTTEIAANRELQFAIIVCDLNDLKHINDTFGHSVGNSYIKNSSAIMCDVFQHSPVYRTGGDEFVIYLTGRDYADRTELFAELRRQVNEAVAIPTVEDGHASLASGIAEFDPKTDFSVSAVFKRADDDMYQNKNSMKAQGGEPDPG